eukprot:1377403-Pleurochrysis_carterae.AAC.1
MALLGSAVYAGTPPRGKLKTRAAAALMYLRSLEFVWVGRFLQGGSQNEECIYVCEEGKIIHLDLHEQAPIPGSSNARFLRSIILLFSAIKRRPISDHIVCRSEKAQNSECA